MEAGGERRPRTSSRGWLVSLLLAGLLLRFVAAWASSGIIHPDEHQQYLEQSFRLLHGYGAAFWEQDHGMRHPLFAALLAGVLWLGERAGVGDPHVLAAGQRLALALASFGALAFLAWSLHARGRRVAGLTLAVLLVCCVDLTFIQVRVMSENACVAVLALVLAWWPRRPLLVGMLLGLLPALRIQTATLPATLWVFAVWTDYGLAADGPGRRRTAIPLTAGLALSLLFLGWFDSLYHGDWFHSFQASVQKNWVEDGASTFGISPAYSYLLSGTFLMLRVSLAALVFLAWGARRRPDLACLVLLFVLAHSLIPHKEVRFLWPLAPVGCLLLAEGFEDMYRRGWCRDRIVLGCLVASLLLPSLARVGLMQWRTEPYTASCQTLAWVGLRGDVRGVVLVDLPIWASGNYFYLRSPVPIRYLRGEEQRQLEHDQAWQDGTLNYVVAPQGSLAPALLRQLRRVGGWRDWTIYTSEVKKGG